MDKNLSNLELILNDPERLAAVSNMPDLNTSEEKLFERVMDMICHDLHVPIALVTLVEPGRQFFLSHKGLPPDIAETRETPISHSICKYVVECGATLAVNDARISDKLKDHPAVLDLNVVAYLGAPLLRSGQIIGSVCAIDTTAREWSPEDIALIERRAGFIRAELYLRRNSNNYAK